MSNKNFKIKNGLDVESIISASNINLLDEYPDISPSLNLDFANAQTLDPRITFTRASTATYTGSDGLIKIASVDQPRFDFANTGECKGLLIEEARINLATYSEQFDHTSWVKANTTISINANTAPDGTLTADKLIESNTYVHFIEKVINTVSGTSYTFSIYVKSSERSIIQLAAYTNVATSTNFDLSAMTVSNQNGTIIDAGNGWRRCSFTLTSGFTGVGYFDVYLFKDSVTSNYVGDGVSGVYIWGAQVEAGSFSTSYIPTTTASSTRAADLASMTGTNFSSWYNQTEGTILSISDRLATETIVRYPFIYDISNGTANNRISTLWATHLNQIYTAVIVNGVYTVGQIGYAGESQTPTKNFAVSYKLDNYAASLNGKTPISDTSAFVPAVDRIQIGCQVGLSEHLNGHISKLVYYPERLSNAILQNLTK
jgi:hypothetical protein